MTDPAVTVLCDRHPQGRPGTEHHHEHVHHDGERYWHSHQHPCCDRSSLAAKPHWHGDIHHSHPHPEAVP